MEKIADVDIQKFKELSRKNKGLEYRSLWVKVNFGIVRDKLIRKVGAKAFVVFLVIRTYANKELIAFPSLETISYYSGLNPKTVQRAVRKLILNDWIVVNRKRGGDGRFESLRYQILETNYIRGTGDPSFLDKPVIRVSDGSNP